MKLRDAPLEDLLGEFDYVFAGERTAEAQALHRLVHQQAWHLREFLLTLLRRANEVRSEP